jgi:hypothetical protein
VENRFVVVFPKKKEGDWWGPPIWCKQLTRPVSEGLWSTDQELLEKEGEWLPGTMLTNFTKVSEESLNIILQCRNCLPISTVDTTRFLS